MVFTKDGLSYPDNPTECADTKCDNCGLEFTGLAISSLCFPHSMDFSMIKRCVLAEAV